MYRKYRVSSLFLQHLLYAAAVTLVWMIAFQLRYHVFAGQGLPENEAFFLKLTPVIVFTSLIFYNVNHLYETHRYTSWYQETLEIVLANLQSLVTFVFLLYFFPPGRFSRLTIFFYLPTTQVTMVAVRLLSRFLIRHSRGKAMNLRYTVLVGGLVIWRGCSQSRIEREEELVIRTPWQFERANPLVFKIDKERSWQTFNPC